MTSTPKSWMDSEFGYKREYIDDDVDDDVAGDDYIYNEDENEDYEDYEEEEEDDTNDP